MYSVVALDRTQRLLRKASSFWLDKVLGLVKFTVAMMAAILLGGNANWSTRERGTLLFLIFLPIFIVNWFVVLRMEKIKRHEMATDHMRTEV